LIRAVVFVKFLPARLYRFLLSKVKRNCLFVQNKYPPEFCVPVMNGIVPRCRTGNNHLTQHFPQRDTARRSGGADPVMVGVVGFHQTVVYLDQADHGGFSRWSLQSVRRNAHGPAPFADAVSPTSSFAWPRRVTTIHGLRQPVGPLDLFSTCGLYLESAPRRRVPFPMLWKGGLDKRPPSPKRVKEQGGRCL